MHYQVMAWVATGVFGGAIAWVKMNGGKISAWLTFFRDIIDFGDDLNRDCADGKASAEEMQALCMDYNKIMADLGLAKKGTSK